MDKGELQRVRCKGLGLYPLWFMYDQIYIKGKKNLRESLINIMTIEMAIEIQFLK